MAELLSQNVVMKTFTNVSYLFYVTHEYKCRKFVSQHNICFIMAAFVNADVLPNRKGNCSISLFVRSMAGSKQGGYFKLGKLSS